MDDLRIINKNIIFKIDSNIESHYKVVSKLGKGSFGEVLKVYHLKTETVRAMKIINKSNINCQEDENAFIKEIEILMQIDHPNIIKIYEYFEDTINYYLISEFVSCGQLYDKITKWKKYSEYKIAYIMNQLLSAVFYLHTKNIIHRDLKPEMFLISSIEKSEEDEDLSNIKLIDFGTSCVILPL